MISVIIPHYNNQSTIARAISSVLNQSYQNFEIIIVDDFSKDVKCLEKIISEINDNRITLIKHTENKNGSSARNTGVDKANGEYIAFLDADDEWNNNHLEKSIELSKGINTPHLVYSKSIVLTSNVIGSPMPEAEIEKNQSIADYLFCDKGFMPTPSFFLKRKLALKVRWNEKLKRHQDYDYLFQLEKYGVKSVMSNNVGVTIHWENNDTEKKGGTWQYSLNYAKKNKSYFSDYSYNCFLLKNVVYPLLIKREIMQGIKLFIKECNPKLVSAKQYVFLLNYMSFGNLSFLSKLIKTSK